MNTEIQDSFEGAIEKVKAELKKEGFGVLTEIRVDKTLKEKINVDFRRYIILGACNPHFAHQALSQEDKIGTMLPCNVIVQEKGEGRFEVAAVDPKASMMSIENEALADIAEQVEQKLALVIKNLH